MKLRSFLLFVVCLSTTSIYAQPSQKPQQALEIINNALKTNESGKGFHSIHMFSTRQIGDRSASYADDSGIHFEEKTGENQTKNRVYKFEDMNRITILDGERSKFGSDNSDEIQLLIQIKGSRTAIIAVKKAFTDQIIEAFQTVNPNLKIKNTLRN